MYIKKITRQSGISLVEVIVTILILSIGLLGMAALQNTSLKLAYDSYLRTQASFLAYDLIDRIRANPGVRYQLSGTAQLLRRRIVLQGIPARRVICNNMTFIFGRKQADEFIAWRDPRARLR